MDIQTLTGGLDPRVAGGLLAASFAGSFMTVALGIGGGAFLLAIMASLMPPAALIPIHGVIQLGSNAFRAALFWRVAHRPAVWSFALGAVIGVALGGWLAVDLPGGMVQIGVGAFILWTVLAPLPRWLSRSAGVVGAVSSFLTMFFGATGPFVAAFIKTLSLTREAHVATHAVLMTLQHGLKIVTFGALGFSFGPWLPFLGLMILCGFAGTVLGRQVLLRIDDRLFHRALSLILTLISVRLIWQGVMALT